MNLLDENIPRLQWEWLRERGVSARQIRFEVSYCSIDDDAIIRLLHSLKRVTFFTQDRDFFLRRLCHPAYGLVKLDVDPDETGLYVRRFLRHPAFAAQAERMDKVVRVHADGIQFWQSGTTSKMRLAWSEE